MPSPIDIWRKFFEACDLPTKIQNKYAEAFASQRIQPNMLMELDKSTLRELGVDALGDQLAILRYIKQTNGVDAPAFKLIQSNTKEPVTTTGRETPDRHVLRAKATSSSVPMTSRSITIKKPQVVQLRPSQIVQPRPSSGLRSDEILREREMSSHRDVRSVRTERPLMVRQSPAIRPSPYTAIRQTQLSARDSRRQSPRSDIRERITYNNRGPIVVRRRF